MTRHAHPANTSGSPRAHGGNRGIFVAASVAVTLVLPWVYAGAARWCAHEPALSCVVFALLGLLVAAISSASLAERAGGEPVPWATRVGDAVVSVEWAASLVFTANLLAPFASGEFLLLWLAVMASAAVLGGLVAEPALSFLGAAHVGRLHLLAGFVSLTEGVAAREARFTLRVVLYTLTLAALFVLTVVAWFAGVAVVVGLLAFVVISVFTSTADGPPTQQVRRARRRGATTARQGSGVFGVPPVGPWDADTAQEPAWVEPSVARPFSPVTQWALLIFVLTLLIGLGTTNLVLRSGAGARAVCKANGGAQQGRARGGRASALRERDDAGDDNDDEAEDEAPDEVEDDSARDDMPGGGNAADEVVGQPRRTPHPDAAAVAAPDPRLDAELYALGAQDDDARHATGRQGDQAVQGGSGRATSAADDAVDGRAALVVSVAFVGEHPDAPRVAGLGASIDEGAGPGLVAPPLTASSSSTADPVRSKGIRYDASRAVDGRTDTWWQEDVAGDGLGETLRLDWGREARIGVLRVVPGYAKRADDRWGDRWPVNNRLRRVRVRLSSGAGADVELSDQRGWHEVRLPGAPLARWVEIEVLSVHPGRHPRTGARIEDTGVSEAQVWLLSQ